MTNVVVAVADVACACDSDGMEAAAVVVHDMPNGAVPVQMADPMRDSHDLCQSLQKSESNSIRKYVFFSVYRTQPYLVASILLARDPVIPTQLDLYFVHRHHQRRHHFHCPVKWLLQLQLHHQRR